MSKILHTLRHRNFLQASTLTFILTFSGDFPPRFTMNDFQKISIVTGKWTGQRKGSIFGESWTRKSATELTGVSYKITNGDSVPLETVRLYMNGTDIIYAPVTFGQNDEKEVLFKLKSINKNEFIFENPTHDFPQQIVYDFVTKDSLHAYIEGKIQSQTERIDYHYRRQH